MIDHLSLRVQDFPRALAFYKAALAPIGYQVVMEVPGADYAGFGEPGKPELWISRTDRAVLPTHIAFRSQRGRIDLFHAAAVAAGGTDNGGPGLRADYHPHYYAAFVLDPEGNNIEVVCHDPPGMRKPVPTRAASPRRPAKKVKKPARKPAKRAAKTRKRK